MDSAIHIRDAVGADLGDIAAVTRSTGQPEADSGADGDYVALLRSVGHVAVACEGDEVVGWGAARPTPYGSLLSDLFVEPGHQGRGVGRRLLAHLWDPTGDEARFTFSSQHPGALPVYVGAGLTPVWPLLYLAGDARRLPSSPLTSVLVSADEAAAAEATLMPGDRAADYRYWARRPTGTGLVVLDGDVTVAAGAGDAGELAHLACPVPHLAAAAVLAALAAAGTSHPTLCLPGPHPALAALLGAGFTVEEYDLAMVNARANLPTAHVYSPGLA